MEGASKAMAVSEELGPLLGALLVPVGMSEAAVEVSEGARREAEGRRRSSRVKRGARWGWA